MSELAEALEPARRVLRKANEDAAIQTMWFLARQFGKHLDDSPGAALNRERLALALEEFLRS